MLIADSWNCSCVSYDIAHYSILQRPIRESESRPVRSNKVNSVLCLKTGTEIICSKLSIDRYTIVLKRVHLMAISLWCITSWYTKVLSSFLLGKRSNVIRTVFNYCLHLNKYSLNLFDEKGDLKLAVWFNWIAFDVWAKHLPIAPFLNAVPKWHLVQSWAYRSNLFLLIGIFIDRNEINSYVNAISQGNGNRSIIYFHFHVRPGYLLLNVVDPFVAKANGWEHRTAVRRITGKEENPVFLQRSTVLNPHLVKPCPQICFDVTRLKVCPKASHQSHKPFLFWCTCGSITPKCCVKVKKRYEYLISFSSCSPGT